MPERTWCEACRDHFGADHYTEDGSHRCGPEFGPAGADMAKLREFDALEARASALADALRMARVFIEAISRADDPGSEKLSDEAWREAYENAAEMAREVLAEDVDPALAAFDAAVPLPHKENT